MSGRGKTYEEVRTVFEAGGCKLLSKTYINPKIHLDYVCQCGETSQITFAHFRTGRRCKKCGAKKVGQLKRFSYEEAVNIFRSKGCTLLSKDYHNSKTPMRYICKCGCESRITLSGIQQGRLCKKCGYTRAALTIKFSLEQVREIFADGGCVLLSNEYIDNNSKLRYICECGSESIICLSSLQRGTRCKKCGVAKAKRTAFSRKQYTFPAGREVVIQGNENHCIDQLLAGGTDETDIVVEDVPTISYNWNNKSRTYYPDIYIPTTNSLIEVKSYFTWSIQALQNLEKMKAASKSYNIELRVYDKKGTEIYRRTKWEGIEPFLLDENGNEKSLDDTVDDDELDDINGLDNTKTDTEIYGVNKPDDIDELDNIKTENSIEFEDVDYTALVGPKPKRVKYCK